MAQVKDYSEIVGNSVIDELFTIGDKARSLTIQHVNSTAVGGGVAEILTRLVPMLNELGVQSRWDVIKGGEKFFAITKKMHNALHGVSESFSDDDWNHFLEVDRENARSMNLDGNVLFIHDPQPIGLVEQREHLNNKWVWRCHIDFSEPQQNVWLFLKDFIEKFDAAIFSAPAFSRPLNTKQFLVSPSIDPLSNKNKYSRRGIHKKYIREV